MNFWTFLTFAALAQCAHSCPDLCSCSGGEVVCSQISLTHFPVDGLPSNTTRLSIKSSNLSSITASHLSAVPLLSHLQLHYNNLTSLPSDLLKHVPHLNILDLTGNQLVHLPPNIFNHTSLRRILLSKNLIEKADAEWFPDNSSVTRLDMYGNRLTVVPTVLLQRLPNLESLELSDNNLRDLQPDALKNLHHLKVLNLGINKLSSLNATIFSSNLKLTHLFLHQNQLQELPATLFQGLQRLELLLLFGNQLQYLPTGLLDDMTSSFLIILRANPWVCDERIEYLWKWVTSHSRSVLFLEDVACAKPEALERQRVKYLTESDLGLHKSQHE